MTVAGINRTVGAFALPTTAGVSGFSELDPGHDLLLNLLKTAINADLGTAWSTACGRVSELSDTVPVQTICPLEPDSDAIGTLRVKFPLLCVWPSGEPVFEEFTRGLDKWTQVWAVDYILPPMGPESRRIMLPALRLAQKSVQQTIRTGGHPDYGLDANGAQPKQVLIGQGSDGNGGFYAGFSRVRYMGALAAGPAAFGEGSPTYWATRMQIETVELGSYTDPAVGVAHVGGRFFFGTGTGNAADDGTGEDDNGIIEEEVEAVTVVN